MKKPIDSSIGSLIDVETKPGVNTKASTPSSAMELHFTNKVSLANIYRINPFLICTLKEFEITSKVRRPPSDQIFGAA